MNRLVILAIAAGLGGCTKTVYVPVETVRTEYVDTYRRDSVHVHDSVYIRSTGDTLLIDRWHTLYREVLKIDTFLRTDSVQVPFPVEKTVYVNKLHGYQKACMWIGVGAVVLLMVGLIKRFR